METLDAKPIDLHALAHLLADRYQFMTWLTDSATFYRSGFSSYVIAGSFTGYLLQRFGWERYRSFFRRATTRNFSRCFAQVFGLRLLAAEHAWGDDLVGRRALFEPELARLAGELRVESAYAAGHFYQCIEEADVLTGAGTATSKVCWLAAAAHASVGHYDQAIPLLERAIASDDRSMTSRGTAWLHLGNFYDLSGERARARLAYDRVLGEVDDWSEWCASTHDFARRYRAKPYSLDDFDRTLRTATQQTHRGHKARP
jgi:hypothetical protein